MAAPAKNILLTGLPGCGKTTVIRSIVDLLGDLRLAGFYTQELREHGRRVGFEAIGLGGRRELLAHVRTRSDARVGRYGMDVAGFERLIETELDRQSGQVDLYVVDEVGKMECCSDLFVAATRQILDSPVPVLATVAAKGGGFIAQVRSRADAALLHVTVENWDSLPETLVRRVSTLCGDRGGK